MIKQIEINNFKSIDKLNIEFSKLNVLCGENASGKTTIIHSILLCSQNIVDGEDINGEIIKIGTYEELKNKNKTGEISIKLYGTNSIKTFNFNRNTNPNENKKYLLDIKKDGIDDFEFEKNIFYLSSTRTSVMDTYKKGNYVFGPDGLGTISFLFNHSDNFLSDTYIEFFNKEFQGSSIGENKKFIEHVRFWMEYITNETISISSIDKTNQYVLLYGSDSIRPINTGSGYSFYCLL